MRPSDRDHALNAVRQFHAAHGRLPRWREWEQAAPDRPCARTIERRWGWRALLAVAVGVEASELVLWDEVIDDRAGKMLAALVEERGELGRWPCARPSELSQEGVSAIRETGQSEPAGSMLSWASMTMPIAELKSLGHNRWLWAAATAKGNVMLGQGSGVDDRGL